MSSYDSVKHVRLPTNRVEEGAQKPKSEILIDKLIKQNLELVCYCFFTWKPCEFRALDAREVLTYKLQNKYNTPLKSYQIYSSFSTLFFSSYLFVFLVAHHYRKLITELKLTTYTLDFLE
ncbi:hypothetical protein BpHYR1_051365 [Brachionus plicatilis]|uniref:Uncharacterized protein n=1 Tax=Brachionus plicatilis TaxID=10195 RepID=A0A3M7RK91_BRAPC|nr:hypothetical protein BpHYR1_051365 [Brachionus plicatilis]